ncbi:MAG: RNA polymerase sigma factor SigJ [Dehalococcoidia bacterium]
MMHDNDAFGFEPHRHHLFGVAYRMLGSASDAEDVVQDAFLKWAAVDREAVREARAFLVTTVTRLCLDQLRSAAARRTEYFGPWLPEPIPAARIAHAPSPEAIVDARESVSFGFLVLLQRLNPVERAAFLLREVFEYSYSEVATFLEKSETATRQIVHRAHSGLRAGRERYTCDPAQQLALTSSFLAATATGQLPALLNVLKDDVELWSDGGGRRIAASQVVQGSANASRFVRGLVQKFTVESAGVVELNGQPAVLIQATGVGPVVLLLAGGEGKVAAVYVVLNPEKLGFVPDIAPAAELTDIQRRWSSGAARLVSARKGARSP